MERYQGFRPTAFDSQGLGCDEQQDWFVGPCSITRDSELLSVSNWETMLKCLEEKDPDGEGHEVHRFGHWGPGWFEIVLIRPDSACFVECEEIEGALENYPVLDESDYSEREWTQHGEDLAQYVDSLYSEVQDYFKDPKYGTEYIGAEAENLQGYLTHEPYFDGRRDSEIESVRLVCKRARQNKPAPGMSEIMDAMGEDLGPGSPVEARGALSCAYLWLGQCY